MIINMQQARDGNTVSYWKDTIWRVFLNGKLFISDDHKTCFDTKGEAVDAVLRSNWMKVINDYTNYSQRFFNEDGNEQWRKEFVEKIFDHVGLEFKEYKWVGLDGTEPNTTSK